MNKQEKILKTIAQLTEFKTNGTLDAMLADETIAALKDKLTKQETHTASVTGDGAIAQGTGAKAVGSGGILIQAGLPGDSTVDAPPPSDKPKGK